MKLIDLIGLEIGSFVVIQRDSSQRVGRARWILRCKCGREISRQATQLRALRIPACNCDFEARLLNLPETTKSYIAGIYDGEGSMYIGLQSRSGRVPTHFLEISIANTDKPLLDWVQSVCGGRVSKKGTVKNGHTKPGWTWKASSRQAALFLSCLRPYLRVKASQADVAINFQERVTTSDGSRWNLGIPVAEAEWREQQRFKLIEIRRTA